MLTDNPMTSINHKEEDEIILKVRNWISNVVIGLNLCPFAKHPFNGNLIRYFVSRSVSKKQFSEELKKELILLKDSKVSEIETTLIIHPFIYTDFLDQNDFLNDADEIINKLELEGILQIANFHPNFQFADRKKNDITNYVNRAPFPILHLLREDSISKVVELHPDIDSIFKNNMKSLRALGLDGLKKLNAKT